MGVRRWYFATRETAHWNDHFARLRWRKWVSSELNGEMIGEMGGSYEWRDMENYFTLRVPH